MKITKQQKIFIAAIILSAVLIGVVVAAQTIIAPEHITGNPIDKPEPTPTTEPVTFTLHLTSNNTSPFYKGDSLEMTATLTPALSNINVTLYNNGVVITTTQTDSEGKAVFVRLPTKPFDYTASAEIP